MTSTAPPLLHPPSRLTLRQGPSLACSGQPCRINWPIILASVSASFALVAGIFAWIATHPHKAASPLQSFNVVAVEPLAVPSAPLAPPSAPVFSVTPALHHTPNEKKTENVPLIEIDFPPLLLPSPQSKQHRSDDENWISPLQLEPALKKPAGETYGTQVLFLNNREAAADMARQEHKLMFVMHISGNFEDSCFT